MDLRSNGQSNGDTPRPAAVDEPELYQPLDQPKREIRLVRTLPGDDTLIRCEMGTFSLDSEFEFEALSYCWTSSLPICNILINNIPFAVRPNLFHYLELRHRLRDFRWIFVDAICINQKDLAERSSQVRLMGDVYRSATRVVVWLGNRYRWHHVTLKAIEAITRHCERSVELTQERLRTLGDLERHYIWEAFEQAFLPYEYWSRAWIVQKVALSRNLLFRYRNLKLTGRRSRYLLGVSPVNLNRVREQQIPVFAGTSAAVNHLIGSPNTITVDDIAMYLSADEEYHVEVVASALMRLSQRGSGLECSLSDAIRTFSAQQCSVWHDSVYAFLRLTATATIPVNYSASRIELYTRVLTEGVPEICQATPSPLSLSISEAFMLLLAGLFRAVGILPYHPVAALLIGRILQAHGDPGDLRDITKMLDNFLKDGPYVRKDIRKGPWWSEFQKTQLRLKIHQRFPQTLMQVTESGDAKTYWSWIAWVDGLLEEKAARTQPQTDRRQGEPMPGQF